MDCLLVMAHVQIDEVLIEWSRKRQLPLQRKFKEEDVRSFEIVDTQGRRYQIWIDEPDLEGSIGVHVWDYGKRRKDFVTETSTLSDTLETAYSAVQAWTD